MKRELIIKLIATSILLIIIDRIEFAYYPFQGLDRKIAFACCHEPIAVSWWVYLVTIQLQYFLWTVVLFLWIPLKKEMIVIMIAFGLCVIEFPLTYGTPILQLPLPWQWYFPLSASLLRLGAVCYFMWGVVKKALE